MATAHRHEAGDCVEIFEGVDTDTLEPYVKLVDTSSAEAYLTAWIRFEGVLPDLEVMR